MKNLIKTLGIAGIVGASFLPMRDAQGQETKNASSFKEHLQISKELDTLQDLTINEFNDAKKNYNICANEGGNFLCVYALVGGISLSKKYLEQYISLFEKNKVLKENYANIKYDRDLSITEAREFINNMDLIIEDIAEFIKNPSKEKGDKWQNSFNSTINQTNLYFPPEGVIDLRGILEE